MSQKVAVIGIDGAKPETIERLMKKGLLPNLSNLKDSGTYGHLQTIHASQTPIAWSSIMTGLDIGKHGVYDYLIRDPKSMQLKFGMNDERFTPKGTEYVNLRKGKPVWEILGENEKKGISLFVPMAFPAKNFNGFIVAGMGIPDLRGAQGVPAIYSNESDFEEKEDFYKLNFSDNKTVSKIFASKDLSKEFEIEILENKISIKIENVNEIILKQNEWSEWIETFFEQDDKKIESFFRFKLLKFSNSEIRLYLSPVMYSPKQNFIPVVQPKELGKELIENAGMFKALSFESDVYGLKQKIIDEETWIEDMKYTFDKRIQVSDYLLKNKPWNFFMADYMPVDRVQHLFWRAIDKKHPLHDESKQYENTIDEVYAFTDQKIGELLKNFTQDDLVFVVSDHGFCSYRKNVELNKILMEKGYLHLKDEKKSESLNDIDWSKTKAYALGFGAIYINLQGRELYGVVEQKDYDLMREQIIEDLTGFSFQNELVLKNVLKREEAFSGGSLEESPDLVPLYADGFRSGSDSTLGKVSSKEIVHDNLSKWSADHVGPFDFSDNFGIIFSNQQINVSNASVFDIAVSSLDFFNLKKENEMVGKSLLLR